MGWQDAPLAQPATPRWATAPLADPTEAIDYGRPRHEVWAAIDKLPEERKYDAYRKWAERRVAGENAQSAVPQLPNVAADIPVIGGWLDEAAAGINAGLEYAGRTLSGAQTRGFGDLYQEEAALARERERQAREAAPVLSAVSSLAVPVATAGPLLARLPVGGATAAGRIATGAAIGAPIGAAEGFSRGEGGVTDRARSAESGAKWGALFGAAVPAATVAAGAAYNAAAPHVWAAYPRVRAHLPAWVTGADPNAIATDILAARARSAGVTPAEMTRRFAEGERVSRFNPNSTAVMQEGLVDVDPEFTRLGGAVYRSGGEAANTIRTALDTRQEGARPFYRPARANEPPSGQGEEIEDAARRALLIETRPTARATEEALTATRGTTADALYEAARANSEPFDLGNALTSFTLRAQQYGQESGFRSILNRAISLFRDPSRPGYQVTNIERFDLAYRQLADMIDGAPPTIRRELINFRNMLLDEVHGIDAQGHITRNAAYQQARQAYRLASDEIEAIDLGRRALNENSEVSVETWRALDPAHRALFRQGLEEGIRTRLGGMTRGQDATRLFRQRRIERLLSEVIPRSQRAAAEFADRPERFGAYIERKGRQAATRQAITGGSQTAERLAEDGKFAADAVGRFVQGVRGFGNMGLEILTAVAQRAFGMRQDVAAALARQLVEFDPARRAAMIAEIARRYGTPGAARMFGESVHNAGLLLIPAAPIETPDERRR